MDISFAFALGLVALSLAATMYLARPRRYPPGPKGIPILGVALEHPKSEFWRTYAQWGREHGVYHPDGSCISQWPMGSTSIGNKGLISFHILGRRFVVINSASVAEDLLDKRSAIYSDRPFPPMAGHLMRRKKSIFYR